MDLARDRNSAIAKVIVGLVVVIDTGLVSWGIVVTLEGYAPGHLDAQMYPIGTLLVAFALGIASWALPDPRIGPFAAFFRLPLAIVIAGAFGIDPTGFLLTTIALLAYATVRLWRTKES